MIFKIYFNNEKGRQYQGDLKTKKGLDEGSLVSLERLGTMYDQFCRFNWDGKITLNFRTMEIDFNQK